MTIWEKVNEIESLCLKIKNRWSTEKDYEEIRGKYDPRKQGRRVRILFIGESPPGTTFFYCMNSKLFYATKRAFEKAYNRKLSKRGFLLCFKHLGCYLIDFFNGYTNRIVNSHCQDFKDQINYIINQIRQINPEFIIVVHERICYCVELALISAGLSIKNVRCLPFPRGKLRKKQRGKKYIPNEWGHAYIHQFVEIIKKELIPKRIFPRKLLRKRRSMKRRKRLFVHYDMIY